MPADLHALPPACFASTTLPAPMKRATKRESGRSYTSSGVPICSMRPAFMTTMRSAIVIASTWSCVT